MKKLLTSSLAVALVLFSANRAWADTGMPDPISLDRASSSVVTFGNTPGDIYDMLPTGNMGWDVGGPGPIVHIVDTSYGLTTTDNNDGHSNGELDPTAQLSIFFSGDDFSAGMPGTDYLHQSTRLQAAGDRFMLNGATTLSPAAVMAGGVPSGVAGPMFAGGNGNFPINLLNANQHRYNQIPSISPGAFNTTGMLDDMDALELAPMDMDGTTTHTLGDTSIFFSLDALSPSLTGSAADIQVTAPGAGAYGLFAAAATLGLGAPDDVDALALWDMDGNGAASPGIDFALFSLAPGSPALGAGGSAADIYVTDFSGTFNLYLTAASLGMLATDNIDALDVELLGAGGWPQEPLDSVPEPSTILLLGLGAPLLLWRRMKI